MAEHCLNSDTAPVNPVTDPHPEWLVQWRIARAAVNADIDEANMDRLWPHFITLEDQILQTPAQTTAGVVAQLTLLVEEEAYGLHDAPALSGTVAEVLSRVTATLATPRENVSI